MIIERLQILKYRKNMSTIDVIKRIRLRTGFFKVYESVDRIDMLELENKVLKRNIRDVKEEAITYKNQVEQYKETTEKLAERIRVLES